MDGNRGCGKEVEEWHDEGPGRAVMWTSMIWGALMGSPYLPQEVGTGRVAGGKDKVINHT